MAETQPQVKAPVTTPAAKGGATPAPAAGPGGMTKQKAAASAEGYDAQAALLVPPPADDKAVAGAAAPVSLSPDERRAVAAQVRAEIHVSAATSWTAAVAEMKATMPAVLQAHLAGLVGHLDPELVLLNTSQLLTLANSLSISKFEELNQSNIEKTSQTTSTAIGREAEFAIARKIGTDVSQTVATILIRIKAGKATKRDMLDLIVARAELERGYRLITTQALGDQAKMAECAEKLRVVVKLSKSFFDLTEEIPFLKAASLAAKGAIDLAGAISESANGEAPVKMSEHIVNTSINFLIDVGIGMLAKKYVDPALDQASPVKRLTAEVAGIANDIVRRATSAVTSGAIGAVKGQAMGSVGDLAKKIANGTDADDFDTQVRNFSIDTAIGIVTAIDVSTAFTRALGDK